MAYTDIFVYKVCGVYKLFIAYEYISRIQQDER